MAIPAGDGVPTTRRGQSRNHPMPPSSVTLGRAGGLRCEGEHIRISTADSTAPHGVRASTRRPVKVTVYHNDEARFLPYQDGQVLTAITSHWLDAPDPDPIAVAEWAYRTFNADLDLLETERHTPHGELTFLAASVYRLLGHRSLSVGDVVEVHTATDSHWLACDPTGWRRIDEPRYDTGSLLSASAVYQRLAAARRT